MLKLDFLKKASIFGNQSESDPKIKKEHISLETANDLLDKKLKVFLKENEKYILDDKNVNDSKVLNKSEKSVSFNESCTIMKNKEEEKEQENNLDNNLNESKISNELEENVFFKESLVTMKNKEDEKEQEYSSYDLSLNELKTSADFEDLFLDENSQTKIGGDYLEDIECLQEDSANIIKALNTVGKIAGNTIGEAIALKEPAFLFLREANKSISENLNIANEAVHDTSENISVLLVRNRILLNYLFYFGGGFFSGLLCLHYTSFFGFVPSTLKNFSFPDLSNFFKSSTTIAIEQGEATMNQALRKYLE